jgi:hypothetical protein
VIEPALELMLIDSLIELNGAAKVVVGGADATTSPTLTPWFPDNVINAPAQE